MDAAAETTPRTDHSLEVRITVFEGDVLAMRWHQPTQRGRIVPRATLEAAVDALDPTRTRRILFAGGDPFDHPDLAALIERARARGVREIAVECEPTRFADPKHVAQLEPLAIDRIFVVVGAIRQKVFEFVMRSVAFKTAMEGLSALIAAHRGVYVVVPLLRPNAEDAEALLDWLLCLPQQPRGYLLDLPDTRSVSGDARRALLPYAEQARIAVRVFRAAQRQRIEYGFFTRRGLPPCAARGALDAFGTVFYERIEFLRHGSREAIDRVEACAECSLRDSCPGIERSALETFGRDGYEPVPLAVSMNWKLRPLNKLDKHEYKNISDFDNEGGGTARSLVRINGHCNMACAFCFVDRTAPDFESEGLKQEITRLAEKNRDHLVISGGEPTLHPDLPGLVRHARAAGYRTVEMQSNGVRCADEAYCRSLVDAGLDKVTISLHSVDPKHSDEITMLPGAFEKTVRAIHNFRSHGVVTQIAHVITKANYAELPDTVRFLASEFPSKGGHLSVCFAIAQGISDLVYHWVIPRFDEIRPYFRDALDQCLDADIGFGGMIGQGGFPPCMLDGELKYYERNLQFIYKSPESESQFFKSPKCRECSFDPYCLGPRRSYVEHYGDAEIRPFRAQIDHPPPSARNEFGPIDFAQPDAPREQLVTLRKKIPTP